MLQRSTLRSLVFILFILLPSGAVAGTGNGRAHSYIALDRGRLEIFTYRPEGCTRLDLLLIFHGIGRDAENYRNGAEPLADRLCWFVVAPQFDKARYPNWRYQRGGVMHEGRPVPRAEWTVSLVSDLVAWVRKKENLPAARLYLFGHSAGGQFLSRVAAYAPPADAARIVIANPSSHVAPSLTVEAPYGFAGLFAGAGAQTSLRKYLGLPITIYLGTSDTGRHHMLMNAEAEEQGNNRLARGRSIYRMALAEAARHGWPCNWKLVEAQGVGHSMRRMLNAPEALIAFGRPPVRPGR